MKLHRLFIVGRSRLLLIVIACFSSNLLFSQYHFYFGNIHSHSSFSDGNKDSLTSGYYYPGDDYNYAKGSYHMDFLGISEHNHYSSPNNPGMHVADYAKGVFQADTANDEGSFVCMYGLEWGVISNGGHVVVYGINGLPGWETGNGAWGPANNYNIYCAQGDFVHFWQIVNSYPTAFCTLAHPQSGDYNDLAGAATYSASADAAIAGVAVRSGNAFSTTTDYSDPAPTLYQSVYLKALAKGYHVGPTADQDNHYSTFGRTNKIRTVVLATDLKRDSIMSAYKAMRFYASDDWNAQVTFTINGNYMGSDISTASNSSIIVSVTDPDAPSDANDHTSKIEIYYGQPGTGINATVLTSITGSDVLNYTHITNVLNSYYYFAKITQADGNMIWTSPVWVYRNNIVLPLRLVSFTGKRKNDQTELNWTTVQELNMKGFEIERSADGINYSGIGAVASSFQTWSLTNDYTFIDQAPINGINFYRLKEINLDGSFTYSDVITVNFDNPILTTLTIQPNPVLSQLNMRVYANETATVSCNIYNSEGRRVKSFKTAFVKGLNIINEDVSALSAGIYIIVISRPNERIIEGKFMKGSY